MNIELTLVDGNRPWWFRVVAIESCGRNAEDTATMITTPSGTFSVIERPAVIREIITGNGGSYAVLRAK